MMKQGKRWLVEEGNPEAEEALVEHFGISPLLARLLVNRQVSDFEDVRHFLHPTWDDLLDPFLLKGMAEAVAFIKKVIDNQGHIVIYGDYDVDGITATSTLYRCLEALGASVSYYIPERQSEGYGLNEEALQHLANDGTDLVITVDCGITSYDIVDAVKDCLPLIVTDHHTSPEKVPPAVAVINPKQPGCTYPDKNLAGVGVAFKLCQALWQTYKQEPYQEDVDIVALGTVADMVPLIGENRFLVKEGLTRMNTNPNRGIKALIDEIGLTDKTIATGQIGFGIAPRLNAAGRVTHAARGVELLTTNDDQRRQAIANELQKTNEERQAIERDIVAQARQSVLAYLEDNQWCIVVAGENWHPGVIGIVASRLVEEFYKPTIVISLSNDGLGKGSCRSIEGCNMYDMLADASSLLIQFGGHAQAAGLSLESSQIAAFRKHVNDYCQTHLAEEVYQPLIRIDEVIPVEEAALPVIEELAALAPYGIGNRTPVFMSKDLLISSIYLMGAQKKHCKLIFDLTDTGHEEEVLTAVAWQQEDFIKQFFEGDRVDVVFTLQKNEWQGVVSPQLVVIDIRQSQLESAFLTAEKLRCLYLVVHRLFRQMTVPQYIIVNELLRDKPMDMTRRETMLGLQVFEELGLLSKSLNASGVASYTWQQPVGKLDLITSVTYMKYSQKEVG